MYLSPKDYVRSPAALQSTCGLREAEDYTRWLATHHYENFHVVSFLLPRRLHQDFYNVYAYCRWADDLGDEMGDPAQSLRLLSWWAELLDAMYAGKASHPVFVALRGTVARYQIPREPFADLIRAFVQDQTVTRYPTRASLLEYCRYSANPVGRLVLYLCGYRDAERQRLSDATCSALQLANFWQDVAVDLEKGRVYLPLEDLEQNGCPLDDVLRLRATPAFRAAMRDAVAWARELFEEGLPLAGMLHGRLAVDIDLFSRGGMRVLEKIARQDYDVLSRRPAVSKGERVLLLARSVARQIFR
ncbi:MAG: squalene synthase HpnC [Acidobacteria bacterium]|nr:squalene synthase HpnC [Acidobacteriota bacterium]